MKKIFHLLILITTSLLLSQCYKSQLKPSGTYSGHDYVDLGLSVKWATCNIGATKPNEYGNYFAWGETKTKKNYSWENYKYCNISDTSILKYCNDSIYATDNLADSITILEPEDDIAVHCWGKKWRMPTKIELNELKEKCDWKWIKLDGVKGYLITSRIEGYTNRSIFLPASGFKWENSLEEIGSYGVYWSSSLDTELSFFAHYIYFQPKEVNLGDYEFARDFGLTVRPVYP